MRLDPDKDILTKDGKKFIDMSRIKTNVDFLTPLLPEAEKILEMYDGKVPQVCLSTYNDILQRMSRKLGLDKKLSSHKGRKSFGMLVTDEYNMPLKAASLLLGHADERTTKKYYVKIRRRKKSIAFGNKLRKRVEA